jgi:excisionase family DNA binding protein
MARKEVKADILPMLKTVDQMSRISGIGENKLRELMDKGELEYIKIGNRRLIADSAIWDWYNRAKKAVLPTGI